MAYLEKDEPRFWAKVDWQHPTEKGCWLWTAGKLKDGYGAFQLRWQETVASHRWAFEWAYGYVPEGLHVLHTCDNPGCCNPEHLYAGTHQQNMTDRGVRGRAASGERNGKARLSEQDVVRIHEFRALKMTHAAIASLIGVSKSCVTHVLAGRSWKADGLSRHC